MNSLIHGLIPFIDLTALSALIGTLICLLWSMRAISESATIDLYMARYRRVLLLCLLGLSISSIGMLFQRAMVMAGLGIMEISPVLPAVIFNSHYGITWLVRVACVTVAWLVWLFGRRRLNSPIVKILLLLACVVIAFSRSASSHAADNGDFTLQEFSDWFHLLGAISFGGTLLSILLLFSASSVTDNLEQQHIISGIADRFYISFGPVFALLIFSGIYNSWVDVGSFEALMTNPYGQYLSVKLLIVLFLTSRYIVIPQKGKDEAAYAIKFLKRSRTDAFLILAILFFVALFTQEVPARHAAHLKMMEQEHKTAQNQGPNRAVEGGKEQRLVRMTDRGFYTVEVLLKDKQLAVGVNTCDLIMHAKDGTALSGAEIKVVPWMPEMGHGVFDKPVVKEKGGGVYNVENVVLIMEGRWELRLTVKKDNTEDSVTFAFSVTS